MWRAIDKIVMSRAALIAAVVLTMVLNVACGVTGNPPLTWINWFCVGVLAHVLFERIFEERSKRRFQRWMNEQAKDLLRAQEQAAVDVARMIETRLHESGIEGTVTLVDKPPLH